MDLHVNERSAHRAVGKSKRFILYLIYRVYPVPSQSMSLYANAGFPPRRKKFIRPPKGWIKAFTQTLFAKYIPIILGGDAGWVNLMHADGAGTKSILAYLYWKETGDVSVWQGIARDAIAMNLDDLLVRRHL